MKKDPLHFFHLPYIFTEFGDNMNIFKTKFSNKIVCYLD